MKAYLNTEGQKEIATADGSQELLASITATSDEVSIA